MTLYFFTKISLQKQCTISTDSYSGNIAFFLRCEQKLCLKVGEKIILKSAAALIITSRFPEM